ncbi:MAG TPA: PLP-dependent transferase [Bacteroidetes bacterium]|nr:PLP-dependent transferase [Bacteroidota bacterium]
MKFSTKAIHVGQKPDEQTGAVIPPIYMTSTYKQEWPNTHKGYDYTRAGNPNFTNVEKTIASLEKGKFATVFSSGLGAANAIIATLKQGDKVMAGNDLYGGTFRLLDKIFKNFGIELITVDMTNLDNVEQGLKQNPKMVMLESPSNPLLKITDIPKITKLSKKYNALTVVDNTFATPYFQNPLDWDVDVVLHSTTKYFGGHSDIVGGALITKDENLDKKLKFNRMSMGLNPSPFDTWLLSRGIKTLAVRMDKHAQNALKVATFLESHPMVQRVYYPGLTSHPQHEIAKKQMKGYGGIVSVEFNFDMESTKKLISSLKVFTLAESLGGVESLVDHPSSMTHASIPREERIKSGLNDGLVRLSVGIEDIEDMIDDLKTNLNKF